MFIHRYYSITYTFKHLSLKFFTIGLMPYVQIGQRKVLNKRKRSNSVPTILIQEPPRKWTKRKQWTEIQMKAAIDAAKSHKCSINCAAIDHGISASNHS